MLLTFDTSLAVRYASASQKVRVLTEDWVERMIFCPNCGQNHLVNYENNRPVADFCCQNCQEDFELKSKNGKIGKKIVDGAYGKMIERLQSDSNPNFFLLGYTPDYSVCNFMIIPKQFFTTSIIERRKPLAETARRAGWIGCNILLSSIPDSGKIYLVRDGVVIPRSEVLVKWRKTLFLREENKMSARGWMLDIMWCIERIGRNEFTLDDMYAFEGELAAAHPENNHIKDKIRQQLQILRDKGYIDFVSRGHYRLI